MTRPPDDNATRPSGASAKRIGPLLEDSHFFSRPKTVLPKPVATVSTWTAPTPEPVHLPSNYPQSIAARTREIFALADEEFPDAWAQAAGRCAYIVSGLIPLFVETIKNGDLLAAEAEPLMWKVLDRSGLEIRLGLAAQEIWKSSAWRRFQSEMAQAEKGLGVDAGTPAAAPGPEGVKRGVGEARDGKSTEHKLWFQSGEDVLRRRRIVLKNPQMPSKNLCNVFDRQAPPIPLPRDWQDKFHLATWAEAYNNQTLCKRIQKIISMDRKAGPPSTS